MILFILGFFELLIYGSVYIWGVGLALALAAAAVKKMGKAAVRHD